LLLKAMSPEDRGSPADRFSVASDAEAGFVFGKYRLFPRRRRLFAGEEPVELGSRAFEILVTLVEADGRLVGKEELRKRVWPGAVVEDHNIDVQISALRKALGDDRNFIRTEAGRGYRFVAEIRRAAGKPVEVTTSVAPAALPIIAPRTNLPTAISLLVGREHELSELLDLIAMHRLVTLTGAGGIGKTQLGLEAARRALPSFADGAWVVELGSLVEPELLPGAIARSVGIEPSANREAIDQLAAAFQRKHLLLVLDNCEHLIEAVAGIAEALLHGAPRLCILATSQEPLAAEGERIYRVAPLRVPQSDAVSAAQAIEHSAVQLFVERAQAADPLFALDDEKAAAIGKICRHLDGIPLAIELAAARVATIGVDALATRLDDRFRLLTGGRRTALRRHQTLRATLDWSYGLLEETERAVLRRIAIFAGSFTLDSAGVVAACDDIDPVQAAGHVADLVRKSLVTFDVRAAVPRYRLLDTTRAYALEKLAESTEFDTIARRHAQHYRSLLERADINSETIPASNIAARYAPEIDNIRAALTWAFEPQGDASIGVALTATSAPLWMLLSMLRECLDFVTRALSRLEGGSAVEARYEMLLQAALAKSSTWARGPVSATCAASERALELAERLGDTEYQLQALYILWVYRIRTGAYRSALAIAERFRRIAESKADMPVLLAGIRLEGTSLYYLGDNATARAAMERLLEDKLTVHGSFIARFGMYQRVAAVAYLARILWLQGFPDQAMRVAQAGVEEARILNHANSLCMALCDGPCAVAALSGDQKLLEDSTALLLDCAEKHGLGMWHAYGVAFRGLLAVKRGDWVQGLRLLRQVLDDSRQMRVELRYTEFLDAWIEASIAAGGDGESLAMVGERLNEAIRNDGLWSIAELLRMKGELALRQGVSDAKAAEAGFLDALALAHRQGARSWALRAATSFARLRKGEGRLQEARDALVPIYQSFTEGFETADLKAAKALLDSLG
jgi:predicted ATPase/DNA-binding winged helix-turn-helix (wHTH) protein